MPAQTEIAAARLPTDEQLASAIEAELRAEYANPPEGVIVEPDMLRTVVRHSRCAFLSGSRSRVSCTFEQARSPDDGRAHAEAVEWVRETGRWTAATRQFAHVRATYRAGLEADMWLIVPRPSAGAPDWRAPSDGTAAPWLEELKRAIEE